MNLIEDLCFFARKEIESEVPNAKALDVINKVFLSCIQLQEVERNEQLQKVQDSYAAG